MAKGNGEAKAKEKAPQKAKEKALAEGKASHKRSPSAFHLVCSTSPSSVLECEHSGGGQVRKKTLEKVRLMFLFHSLSFSTLCSPHSPPSDLVYSFVPIPASPLSPIRALSVSITKTSNSRGTVRATTSCEGSENENLSKPHLYFCNRFNMPFTMPLIAQEALTRARASIEKARRASSEHDIAEHYHAAKKTLDRVDEEETDTAALAEMIAAFQELVDVLDAKGERLQEKAEKCRQRANALR